MLPDDVSTLSSHTLALPDRRRVAVVEVPLWGRRSREAHQRRAFLLVYYNYAIKFTIEISPICSIHEIYKNYWSRTLIFAICLTYLCTVETRLADTPEKQTPRLYGHFLKSPNDWPYSTCINFPFKCGHPVIPYCGQCLVHRPIQLCINFTR